MPGAARWTRRSQEDQVFRAQAGRTWREADWKRSSSMSEHGQAGPLRARARRRKAARALEKEDQVFAGKGAVLIVAYRLLSTDTAI